MSQYVYGKNVVRQLISDNKKIHEILLMEGLKDREMENLILSKKISVRRLNRKQMDKVLNATNHQGIAASIDDYKVYTLDEVIEAIPQGKQPLLIMLDGLEDPHNLGAILRSADCVNADGVIIGKHRSVQLTPTVAKVSTGAIDTVKVASVTNLSKSLVQLKKQGFWVVGADIDQAIDYRKGQYDVPLVLVIGSEGFGISDLVKKHCDYMVALPMEGSVTSLNASVAAGILMYEIYSKRHPLK